MLIGVHARVEGLILLANSAREFRRLPGVQVENRMDDGGCPG
jgi:predicted nucleic acid-binding protein